MIPVIDLFPWIVIGVGMLSIVAELVGARPNLDDSSSSRPEDQSSKPHSQTEYDS